MRAGESAPIISSAVGKLGEDHGTMNVGTALHKCRRRHGISTADSVPSDAALLIGPEGGLTNEEVAIAIEHGFSLQLGPRILRPRRHLLLRSRRWYSVGRDTQLSRNYPSPNTRRALARETGVAPCRPRQGIQPSQCLSGGDHWIVTAKQHLVTPWCHELDKLWVSIGGVGRYQ